MTNGDAPNTHKTRMLFLGDSTLGDGFRLIGFESLNNPSEEQVERVFRELINSRQNAFVLLDESIPRAGIPSLKQVLAEGGRVVVTTIPPLTAPGELSREVAEQLRAMFGSSTMTKQD